MRDNDSLTLKLYISSVDDFSVEAFIELFKVTCNETTHCDQTVSEFSVM